MKKMMFIIFVAFLSTGCLSQIIPIDEYVKQGVGRPIHETKKLVNNPGSYASRTGWKEKTYQLDNGNWVYVEPDSKNCFIHWEVNSKCMIVGYKLEGGCR